MISALFIATSAELLKYVIMAVLSLYFLMAISYVNNARKNGVNNSTITKQVSEIVLGTVILIIIITMLFKLVGALNVIG
jgi:hypothetical protein